MESTKIYGGSEAYGIPKNLIMRMNTRWIPISNIKFRTCGKHHYQICPECGEKKKNIRLHYRIYHKKFWYKFFIKPFLKAQIGELYGVRFITTKK